MRPILPRTMLTAMTLVIVHLALAASASANSFDVTCTSSHVSNDDPIVYPAQPGAAHEHEFFGARSTDAHSSVATLQRSRTTCAHRRDTAAYWVPTLQVRGIRVRGTMRAYYQRAGKSRAAAPPRGLRVVAGNLNATAPQSPTVTTWQCIGQGRMRQFSRVPACRVGERLGAWVKFPDCWDGRHLDSPDHRSHLAYARKRSCPSTHPVEIMRLATLVTWPVRPQHPAMVRLAAGMLPASGMHGDFLNSWHQPTLRQLRWDCIEIAARCGAVRG